MIKTHRKKITILLSIVSILFFVGNIYAWSVHAMINKTVIENMPEIKTAQKVRVRSLAEFLIKHQAALEVLLEKEELWLQQNLDWYKNRPTQLKFVKGENQNIEERFFAAIRVNPEVNSLRKNYLQILPSQSTYGKPKLTPNDLTFLKDHDYLSQIRFVELNKNDMVSVSDVLTTASDEPDLGMDIGLFSNNKTNFGSQYGFGVQPFGNPNLAYGSQAPFHMGFYHEAGIINVMAGFLKQTYPEYRIHLYKTLAEFAFQNGEDYWGWRFTGWGLHYLGDLSQPYHSTVVPGIGTSRMLCINLIDVIGFSGMKDDAIQIVSNRHLAIESFQLHLMQSEYFKGITPTSLYEQIKNPLDQHEYSPASPRNYIAEKSNKMAIQLDQSIEENVPSRLISDASFELSGTNEANRIVEEVEKAHGKQAVEKLKKMLVVLLQPNGTVTRSYIQSILKSKK